MPHRSLRALIAGLLLAAGLAPAQADPPGVQFLQSYVWSLPDPAFGGFSGIDFLDDGTSFVTVSDAATLWRGRILRDGTGQITGVTASGPIALRNPKGKVLHKPTGDSEGLALGRDGTLSLSFEGPARVMRQPLDGGRSQILPRPKAFAQMQHNSALEALAIDAEGTLYTLPERSGGLSQPFPVWRFRKGAWTQPFAIPREGDWLPVGADFGPDGRFYLLERDFWGLLGFRTRVQVFQIAGDRIDGGTVLLETPVGRHDNLEGLAVWRDGSGAIRLTMISDDNFSAFQRTEIVEYRLTR